MHLKVQCSEIAKKGMGIEIWKHECYQGFPNSRRKANWFARKRRLLLEFSFFSTLYWIIFSESKWSEMSYLNCLNDWKEKKQKPISWYNNEIIEFEGKTYRNPKKQQSWRRRLTSQALLNTQGRFLTNEMKGH